MTNPLLLAVGGAHLDRRGRVRDDHIAEASNPGAMREDVGGGAFNALSMAVQRGVRGALFSLRGGDLAGRNVEEAVAAAGIEDLSATYMDRATPSYTAILTAKGDLITGLADMELYEAAFGKQMRRRKIRDAAAGADAVLCDANLPEEAILRLCAASVDKPLFAIAVSPAKVVRFAPVLERVSCLFMNRREALRLTGLAEAAGLEELAEALSALGLKGGVITSGSRPAIGFQAGQRWRFEVPPLYHIADVTGAGDALAGATAAALMNGKSFPGAVREGIAAAGLALEASQAAPVLREDFFEQALARVPAAVQLD
ncbi:PfkB family carbohydrate kinase [Nitratireductor luteus]|uniref:PfkB family carbohydrate kinase n=1 Tax=Nitratireductor luteus TaxID=2976980 RepID=UPI002240C13E|nr:PfkB family carbohydrate kinase [Nitratireductor luteus]